MIDGIKMKIGEHEYIVPALNLKSLNKVQDKINRLFEISQPGVLSAEQTDIMRDIVLEGLQRNYPDLTPEQLDEMLDLSNVSGVMDAILGKKANIAEATENT